MVWGAGQRPGGWEARCLENGRSLFRPGCALLLDEGAACEPTGLSVAYSLALDTQIHLL